MKERILGFFRMRTLLVILLPIIMLIVLVLLDPDPDDLGSTRILLVKIGAKLMLVALAHGCLKALFDYPEADKRVLFRHVLESARRGSGAGLALIAQAIVFFAIIFALAPAFAQDVRTFVPERCASNAMILKAEQRRWWPDHPDPATLAALAEKESCVTLRSSRCCDTHAQLRTPREEGASILQITRAYSKDGSLRFDALTELKRAHGDALAEWSWSNVYGRADLANRALVLKSRDGFVFFLRIIPDPARALDFADAGYNGGNGGVQSDRRACGMRKGCDPRVWFGNVELTCTKSIAALYGQRSACDINRDHTRDVRLIRRAKYVGVMT